jgi:hypothetical protein
MYFFSDPFGWAFSHVSWRWYHSREQERCDLIKVMFEWFVKGGLFFRRQISTRGLFVVSLNPPPFTTDKAEPTVGLGVDVELVLITGGALVHHLLASIGYEL